MKYLFLIIPLTIFFVCSAQTNQVNTEYFEAKLKNVKSDSLLRLLSKTTLYLSINMYESDAAGEYLNTERSITEVHINNACYNILYDRNYHKREVLYYKGLVLNTFSKYDAAVRRFTEALSEPENQGVFPSNRIIKGIRGSCKYHLDDFRGGIIDLTDAISNISPNEKPECRYYYDRGMCYFNLSNMKDALSDLSMAISINHEYADAYFGRGLVYISGEDTEEGCKDFSRSGELGHKKAYEAIKTFCNNK